MKEKLLFLLVFLVVGGNSYGECPEPSALSGSHEVIVAYYPIFPRWGLPGCPDKDFIGDPENQYPVFGLYTNNTLEGGSTTNEFDFKAMKNAGVTVVNPHVIGISGFPTDLFAQIDAAAGVAGIKWTPTFEENLHNVADLKAVTVQTINQNYQNIFKVDGKEVFFWYLLDDGSFTYNTSAYSSPQHAIAAEIEALRAEKGHVRIILDTACTMGQICQNQSGKETPNDWFRDVDATTGNLRITGFYSWVSVFWAIQEKRSQTLLDYLSSCDTKAWNSKKYQPVISTTPSYNEENWGYTETSCGIGNRVGQPLYNEDHLSNEWESNLDDSLLSSPSDAWLYIQAYDEWGEGTTIAPNTKTCFKFLEVLKQKLNQHNWLSDSSKYCRPDWPENNVPETCAEEPDLNGNDEDVFNDTEVTDSEINDESVDEKNDENVINDEAYTDNDPDSSENDDSSVTDKDNAVVDDSHNTVDKEISETETDADTDSLPAIEKDESACSIVIFT